MPKINRSQLFAYRLRYPRVADQDAIINFLGQVQVEIVDMWDVEANDTDLLDAMKQAILAQAFRGEL